MAMRPNGGRASKGCGCLGFVVVLALALTSINVLWYAREHVKGAVEETQKSIDLKQHLGDKLDRLELMLSSTQQEMKRNRGDNDKLYAQILAEKEERKQHASKDSNELKLLRDANAKVLAALDQTKHLIQGSAQHPHASSVSLSRKPNIDVFDGYGHQEKALPRPAGATLSEIDGLWMSAVDPHNKIVLVSPYKVASSELHLLFFRLMGDPDWWEAEKRPGRQWKRSVKGCEWLKNDPFMMEIQPSDTYSREACDGKSFRKATLQDFRPFETNASAIMSSPQWRKAMIARNPLDRFQSGFVDKCVMAPRKGRGNSPYHCPLRNYPAGRWRDMKLAVDLMHAEWSAAQASDDTARLMGMWMKKFDIHFAPQWRTAGVYKFLGLNAGDGGQGVDFLGHYSKYHMGSVVREMLAQFGVEDAFYGWGPDRNKTILADRPIKKKGGGVVTREEEAAELDQTLRKHFSPAMVRKVYQMFRPDFDLFGFEPPSWAFLDDPVAAEAAEAAWVPPALPPPPFCGDPGEAPEPAGGWPGNTEARDYMKLHKCFLKDACNYHKTHKDANCGGGVAPSPIYEW